MNALRNEKTATYLNDNFICTYQKVGTFKIVNGNKQGGNVAGYFCLWDKSVLAATAGPVTGEELLTEARFALETRKMAYVNSYNPVLDKVNHQHYRKLFNKATIDRYLEEGSQQTWKSRSSQMNRFGLATPSFDIGGMPHGSSKLKQVHWLLATKPLANLSEVYPFVWKNILNEKLSTAPVDKR